MLALCWPVKHGAEVEHRLRDLRERSSLDISDGELQALETYARRMRGEVFFAER